MLNQKFPDDRAESRFSLSRLFSDEAIDGALRKGYLVCVGKNAVGGFPLYKITLKGKLYRDNKL
jgi:hypothetical protein